MFGIEMPSFNAGPSTMLQEEAKAADEGVISSKLALNMYDPRELPFIKQRFQPGVGGLEEKNIPLPDPATGPAAAQKRAMAMGVPGFL